MLLRMLFCGCMTAACLVPVAWGQSCQEDENYQYAGQLKGQGACTDAIAVYDDVLQRYPTCMAAKIEVGLCLVEMGEYEKAEKILTEVREVSLLDSYDIEGAAKVRELLDIQLVEISRMQKRSIMSDKSITLHGSSNQDDSRLQFSASMGGSDNINGGLDLDELTFGPPGATVTKKLGDKTKKQKGSWVDLETAWQSDSLQVVDSVNGRAYVMATWRDVHGSSDTDLGTVRGVVELRPVDVISSLEPKIVLSGGSFILDSQDYRDDLAVGGRISTSIDDHKLVLGYQFADHNYRTATDLDGRYHRLSLAMPVFSEWGDNKLSLSLDFGYQWPEVAERLGDYQEKSARVRIGGEPAVHHTISASYGISQQQDSAPYNQGFFGDTKRNIEQQLLDIGWAVELDKTLSLEANLQHRRRNSDIPLFEHDATDVTLGLRWQLD